MKLKRNGPRNHIKLDFSRIDSDDWDWMVGLFLADGSKYKEKQRQYRVYFYLSPKCDIPIAKHLINILENIGLNPDINLKHSINTLAIRVTTKELFNKLPNKTKEKNFFPKNKDAFIAGFLDGDGYISRKEYCIGFSQTTVKWIGPFISEYLKHIGIRPWKETYYRKAFYYKASLKKVKEKTNIIRLMKSAGELRC